MNELYPNIGKDGKQQTPAIDQQAPAVSGDVSRPEPVVEPTAERFEILAGTHATSTTFTPASTSTKPAPEPVAPIITPNTSFVGKREGQAMGEKQPVTGKIDPSALREVPVGDILHGEVPRVHTFADDVKRALSNDRVSISKIALDEQKRRDEQAARVEVSVRNPRNIALLVVSLILLLGGGLTIWFFITQVGDEKVQTVVDENRIIVTYDNRIDLSFDNVTRGGVGEDISKISTQPLTKDTITAVVYRQEFEPIDPRLFLLQIQSRAPESLIRSLDQQFLLGVYSSDINSPFMLLKTSSYETAYAGMLSWEKELAIDMEGILYKKVEPAYNPGATVSAGQYIDRVIANRDARAYIDATGRVLFYYAFVTNQIIIIAQNEDALKEVIERTQQQNFKR